MIPNERAVIADSLWTATATHSPDAPTLSGAAQADIAIIGAGFTGLSAALHLAERGVDVAVLDAQQPGWGASGRNGGQVNPGFKEGPAGLLETFGPDYGARMIELAGAATDLVFDLIARHGIDAAPRRPGWIRAAHNDKGLQGLEALAEDWQAHGVVFDVLGRAEIARHSGTGAYLGGIIDPRGGSVHPLNYALGLAAAAARHGARLFGNAPVTRIAQSAGRHVLHTAQGRISAEKVLVCTNAYTGPVTPELARSVFPVRSVQVATRPLSANVLRSILPGGHALSDTRRLLLYFRTSPDGRFVMGGRGTYRDASTARQIEALRAVSAQLYPQLEDTDWEHAWGGFVAITRDHFPHLHRIAPGIMAALGYNGRGVALATALGAELAKWAAGARAEDLAVPVTPVTPMPFAFARTALVEAEVLRMRLMDRLGL